MRGEEGEGRERYLEGEGFRERRAVPFTRSLDAQPVFVLLGDGALGDYLAVAGNHGHAGVVEARFDPQHVKWCACG